MGLAVFSFLAIFVLITSAGLLVFWRSTIMRHLSTALSGGSSEKSSRLTLDRAASSFKAVVQPFEKVLPKNPKEVSLLQGRLIRAGYRDDSAVRLYYGMKVLLPVLLLILAFATGAGHFAGSFVYVIAVGMGFVVPDFRLSRRIRARELNVRLGLPELLDLLVICMEAGLGLDQALARAADELGGSQPEISDELRLVILEQRAGQSRADVWKHLAERVNIDVIRTLVSALIQADQFGTSLTKTLRVHSDSLRVQRRQKLEEKAAKTTVKLVFPLVIFIFPSLFVVTLGPAMISMSESMAKIFN